jgi:acetyltransferase
VMNVPTALASAVEAAKSVIAVTVRHRQTNAAKPVIAVWVGGNEAAVGTFEAAGIPNFATEDDAISGFMDLVNFHELQNLLMAAPPSISQYFVPDTAAVRSVIDAALQDNRVWLDPIEIARVFAACDIPITPATLARNADEAVVAARPHLNEGRAVVLKILSPDIMHKSEVGGVRLNLTNEDAVRAAAVDILDRARTLKPEARITGITVFPMIVRPKARELIVGVADDPTFGPIVAFGQGGTAVEVISDKALALPPLDLMLARLLIARTRVSRVLKAYRNVPAADEGAIELLLVKVAQLIADFPEIREVDLNPVLADETGVMALDARVSIAPVDRRRRTPSGHPRFAVRPYPKEWEREIDLPGGKRVLLRPIRPEDEALYPPFLAAVTAEDFRLRFFAPVKGFSHAFIARFTQIDYARAMAFIAIDRATSEMLGVVRLHANAEYDSGEYAILLRSGLKGHGLGWRLMQVMIDYARAEGLHSIEGQVLQENRTMLRMCRELGFDVAADPTDPQLCLVKLKLTPDS